MLSSRDGVHASNAGLRIIRWILQGVCVADVLLGAAILLLPRFLFRLFNVPLPEDLLWFQLIGLMLIPSAAQAFVGFYDSEHCRVQVLISGISRLSTAGFLFVVASVREVPTILIVLAVGEAIVGVLTGYYLIRLQRALGAAKQSALDPASRGGPTPRPS